MGSTSTSHPDRQNEMGRPGSVNDAIQRGRTHYREGEYVRALSTFQAAVARWPKASPLHNNLGVVRRRMERFEEAADAFEQALRLEPASEEAYLNLLDVLLEAGEMRRLLKIVRRYGGEVPPSDEKCRYHRSVYGMLYGESDREFDRSEVQAEMETDETAPAGHVATPDQGPEVRFDHPERSLVLTGIPRSGTSLLTNLVASIPGAWALNETLYEVDRLPEDLALVRSRLVRGRPVENRFDPEGGIATDTQEEEVRREARPAPSFEESDLLASKATWPYLARLPRILEFGYPVLALIRHPVYALGSWGSEKASGIPQARLTDTDMDPKWEQFDFDADGLRGRQAQLWQLMASIIYRHRDRIWIVRYEDLVAETEEVIDELCRTFDCEPPGDIPVLENCNRDERYEALPEIREAVRRFAPIHETFGYSLGGGGL